MVTGGDKKEAYQVEEDVNSWGVDDESDKRGCDSHRVYRSRFDNDAENWG